MTGMAGFVAVTHICLPSLVYTRLFDHVGDVPKLNVPAQLATLDRERPVLVVCQSGVTSLKGAKLLRDAGFGGACSVRGGMANWLKKGLPLEAGDGQ